MSKNISRPDLWKVSTPVQAVLNEYVRKTYLEPKFDVVRFYFTHRVLIWDKLAVNSSNHNAVLETKGAYELNFLSWLRISLKNTFFPPVINKRKQWLSHVMFALPSLESQFSKLQDTLKVWWDKFPPCNNPQAADILLQTLSCQNHAKPSLVFLISLMKIEIKF